MTSQYSAPHEEQVWPAVATHSLTVQGTRYHTHTACPACYLQTKNMHEHHLTSFEMTTQTLGWGDLLMVLISPSPTHRKGNCFKGNKKLNLPPPYFPAFCHKSQEGKNGGSLGLSFGILLSPAGQKPKDVFYSLHCRTTGILLYQSGLNLSSTIGNNGLQQS